MNQDEVTRRLLSGAVVNLEAARIVAFNAKLDLWPAIFQLLGLAAELALKAYVVSRGATEKQCREIGHDLSVAARTAFSRGMPNLPVAVSDYLEHIAPAYRSHEARYLSGGTIELVDESQAIGLVEVLVRHVGAAIPIKKLS